MAKPGAPRRGTGCGRRRRLPRLCFLGDAAECGIDPDHAIIVRRAPGHSEGAGRRRAMSPSTDLRRGIGNEGDAPGAEPARAVGHSRHGPAAAARCGLPLRHRSWGWSWARFASPRRDRHRPAAGRASPAIARPVDPDGERRAFRHQDPVSPPLPARSGLAGEQHRSPPGIGRRRDPGIDAGRHRRQGRQAHSPATRSRQSPALRNSAATSPSARPLRSAIGSRAGKGERGRCDCRASSSA